jgi:hypothetical protein
MKALWPTINPSSPAIVRKARRYEMKLRKALAIAARRDFRRDSRLAALYAGAKVEGVASILRMKKAVVSFYTTPFGGGLHQIYDWTSVEEYTVLDLAADIAWSLRESLRIFDKGR